MFNGNNFLYNIIFFNQYTAPCMHIDPRNLDVISAVDVHTGSSTLIRQKDKMCFRQSTLKTECLIQYPKK